MVAEFVWYSSAWRHDKLLEGSMGSNLPIADLCTSPFVGCRGEFHIVGFRVDGGSMRIGQGYIQYTRRLVGTM